MSPDTHLDTLLEATSSAAESIGAMFDHPDDDWAPVAMFMVPNGGMGLAAIDPEFLAKPEHKDLLAEDVLPALLREQNAVAMVLVTSTWYIEQSQEDADEHGLLQPSQHPDRREALTLMGLSQTAEALWMADITRHENAPPTLEEWKKLPNSATKEITGRFIVPIRQALAHQG